jgi:hypothetical protein
MLLPIALNPEILLETLQLEHPTTSFLPVEAISTIPKSAADR